MGIIIIMNEKKKFDRERFEKIMNEKFDFSDVEKVRSNVESIIHIYELEDYRYKRLKERLFDDIIQSLYTMVNDEISNADVARLINRLFEKEYDPPKTTAAYRASVKEREKDGLLDKFLRFI